MPSAPRWPAAPSHAITSQFLTDELGLAEALAPLPEGWLRAFLHLPQVLHLTVLSPCFPGFPLTASSLTSQAASMFYLACFSQTQIITLLAPFPVTGIVRLYYAFSPLPSEITMLFSWSKRRLAALQLRSLQTTGPRTHLQPHSRLLGSHATPLRRA